MKSVAVLQARTNSSRLPGKVLLPINGMPVVVLAAKRAANTGRHVIVATSEQDSDDGLAKLVADYGLSCFRGSLENTLERVVGALSAYDDQTIVFRLTADNVFPDGALLDEIEEDFLRGGLDYMCCNGESSGLPYGMSAEVTRLGHLREAVRECSSKEDQEHVTPYIARKFGVIFFERYTSLKKGHFRCTIDCLDDYVCAQQVFSGVHDPVSVSALDLIQRLAKSNYQPVAVRPVPKLVFGTVQLGVNYGIANTTGQPDIKSAQKLIKTAIASGVAYLDTAHAYGSSEDVIGRSLKDGWQGRVKIITKLSPMADCPPDALAAVVNAFVDASVFQSCSALGVQTIDVLMLHRASHLTGWHGRVWQRLLELQAAGVITELGVSVQNPDELSDVLGCSEVRYIQLPLNILDWRWQAVVTKVNNVKSSRKLTIHARSALLQGLLPSSDENHWCRAHVENFSEVQAWLLAQVEVCRRENVADLCLAYVSSLNWVDGIATGMENMGQLLENINYFNRAPLTNDQVRSIDNSRPQLREESLNPALWGK